MGRPNKVPLPQRQALNKTLVYTKGAPAAAAHAPGVYIRALRGALRMSQADLAKRSGVSKSNVAAIENGDVDPQVGTLRKLFDAMFCDLIIAPKARKRPTEALAEREMDVPDFRHWRRWKDGSLRSEIYGLKPRAEGR